MIKKLVLVFIALFAIQGYAQEGTASPYSFYGIGSLKFKGTVENRSMGGLSVYKDSIHINLSNPATYAGHNLASYNNESRPVKFSVGGSHSSSKLNSDSGSDRVQASTFDYLALSIPVGKFGFGFGLMPFTSVGYKLETLNDNETINDRYRGEGGLNKAYLSFAYQLTKGLSVGVDGNYGFGNIKNNVIEFRYNNEGEPLQTLSRETNRSDLSGVSFNFGLHYQGMITNKLEVQTSLTFSPKSDLTSKNERVFSSINFDNNGNELEFNNIEADLKSSGLDETILTLPSKFSIGLGIGAPRKWFAGIEYTSQKTSEFSNALYTNTGTAYEDASTLSIGGFFIPRYNAYSSYWNRVVYRTGLRFENTGLNINDESIKEFGISFGVGVPVGNVFSNANIGVEVGKKGTTNKNLIQENFVNFQLSLSLNDRWFNKRKYD